MAIIAWIILSALYSQDYEAKIAAGTASLLGGLINLYPEFVYHFAHSLIGFLVGGGLIVIANKYKNSAYNPKIATKVIYMAVIFALLSNDWNTVWNSILNGQIWKAFFWKTIHGVIFTLCSIGLGLKKFHWRIISEKNLAAIKAVAVLVPILVLISPNFM